MENREKQVLSEKDRLTISQKAMPTDLLTEIFARLPAKSIARCRCVSKQWATILCRRDFTDLFLKMSLARRPCLLFTLELDGKLLFFSAPQPLNPDQNSSPLIADRLMSIPTKDCSFGYSRSVCGWLCSQENPMVCNPSTGQYTTLPISASMRSNGEQTYLGYDPIDKLFKVLHVSNDYRVLTLGTREVAWRIIECSIPNLISLRDGICINGVLYYLAVYNGNGSQRSMMLVCFDVRSEKFKFVTGCDQICNSTLINCKGKLGAICPDSIVFFSGRSAFLELHVLEDAEKQKWSRQIYELPPLWGNIVGYKLVFIIGMTSTGEIVLSPFRLTDPFYIFYYNLVKNTVVPVEIQLGVVPSKGQQIYTFMDHVEDVKLLELPRSS